MNELVKTEQAAGWLAGIAHQDDMNIYESNGQIVEREFGLSLLIQFTSAE